MLGLNRNPEDLKQRLQEVNQEIASHPLSSERLQRGQKLVEQRKAENVGPVEIDKELTGKGMPTLQKQGKTTAIGTWSWWKLHRRRRKIERKLDNAT